MQLPWAIKGLTVEVTDLTGPATIPASSLQLRYPRLGETSWFDGLETFPLETVPINKKSGGAVQPVWLTVNIPRDAKPGKYNGHLKIKAGGAAPTEVPVELEVTDWTLPESADFITHVGLVQSPESLALQYGVALWSEKHWELLDRTFRLLGQVGTKVIYVTIVRRTHFGNEHGMVRFTRSADGKLKPDFSIADRYLALAVKHLGRKPIVGAYCWEPPSSVGHFGRREAKDRNILISVQGKAGGKLEKAEGPEWGTPQCQAFWNNTFGELKKVLKKHGLDKSMMFAMAGDYFPTKTAVEQLHKAAPESKWIVHCHPYRTNVHGVPVGYLCSVWGVFGTRDPAQPKDYYGNNRYYGWKNPLRITAFPRAGNPIYNIRYNVPIALYRFMAEGALVAAGQPNKRPPGVRGFGRIGADFWNVLKGKRSRRGGTFICGRYPESAWGQLNLAYGTPYVLAPGKNGAIATTRSEMLREGLQEAEARVFIEKALLDSAKKAKLGKALAEKYQALLDERVRTFMRAGGVRERLGSDWTWYFGSDWQKQSQSLYSAAAEVQKKLGGR